jgi:molybdopterin molybdotransferase
VLGKESGLELFDSGQYQHGYWSFFGRYFVPFKDFFKVKTSEEINTLINRFHPLGEEKLNLAQSLSRILAEDIVSPIDLPPFRRSTVDGYGLRAHDTFGASENNPALLTVAGEVVMGTLTDLTVSPGETLKVPTGGMVPHGADAVLMLEFSEEVDKNTIQVKRPVAPLENVVEQGEDIRKGEHILSRGHRIRPQDMGAMAALGKSTVTVYKKPTVAIVSSGDEIVDVTKDPRPGQIRDVNRYAVSAQVEIAGGVPHFMGISPDSFEDLRALCEQGITAADMVMISGGSSVGTMDHTIAVITSFSDSEIMVHGVSLRPGKPTIIGRIGPKPIVGLPGHPVSAMIVFDLFLRPLIWRLAGFEGPLWPLGKRMSAILTRNLSSAPGREDYIRVKIDEKEGHAKAHPILGKSGSVSTMVRADGLIRIDMDSEGLDEGTQVDVLLF